MFKDTSIHVCMEGTRYLGAAIGKASFLQSFARDKVDAWVCEIETLSTIALDQPQAAYAAFIHGVRSRWNYLMRTMPEIYMELQPLEDAIHLEFILALTGQNNLSDELRNLLALPARTGGLGLNNPVREAVIQFHTSVNVTAPLVKLVLQQSRVYPTEAMAELSEIKSQIHQEKQSELASTEVSVFESLPNPLKKAKEL